MATKVGGGSGLGGVLLGRDNDVIFTGRLRFHSLLSLLTVAIHALSRVEIGHGLEGINGNQNGTRGRVDNVGVVAQPQGMEDGRFVQVCQADQVIDSSHHGGVHVRAGRLVAAALVALRQVPKLNVLVVGRLELLRIHHDVHFKVRLSTKVLRPRAVAGQRPLDLVIFHQGQTEQRRAFDHHFVLLHDHRRDPAPLRLLATKPHGRVHFHPGSSARVASPCPTVVFFLWLLAVNMIN